MQGIIATTMEYSKAKNGAHQKLENRVFNLSLKLDIDDSQLVIYRTIFTLLGKGCKGAIDRDTMRPLVSCVNALFKVFLFFSVE